MSLSIYGGTTGLKRSASFSCGVIFAIDDMQFEEGYSKLVHVYARFAGSVIILSECCSEGNTEAMTSEKSISSSVGISGVSGLWTS